MCGVLAFFGTAQLDRGLLVVIVPSSNKLPDIFHSRRQAGTYLRYAPGYLPTCLKVVADAAWERVEAPADEM
jgi:hypothetical protein